MALAKTGYLDAFQLTTKEKVNINDDGVIAGPGEQVVGTKTYSITVANASNTLEENHKVFSFFMDLLRGTSNKYSNTAQVKWTAGMEG